jgi:hypothetical protein
MKSIINNVAFALLIYLFDFYPVLELIWSLTTNMLYESNINLHFTLHTFYEY